MSESQCHSCQVENWKKPDKSIKLVVKKRLQKRGNSNVLKARSLNATEVVRTQLKRHNPFSCSPRKKANISRPSKNQENIKLFNDLDKFKSPTKPEEVRNIQYFTSNNVQPPEAQTVEAVEQREKPPTKEIERKSPSAKNLPLDWSLKTRVRFTSRRPFSWCSKLLGNQEAEGICNFVQRREDTKPQSGLHSPLFQQNIMYWVHPVLPWVSLFPRLSSEIKLTRKIPSVVENDEIAEALQDSWAQSFRSLFNLLRCGSCDYFYLCSSQCTMLFRAAKIGGLPSMSVVITPTTKGMREAFDKEGIAYTLPVLSPSRASSAGGIEDDEQEEQINDNLNAELDEEDWLDSMGVGEETLPQLRQSKINQERIRLRNIDHQGSSVVVVTGLHAHALFNYILNCKNLVAKTGSLVGIPPTLLAPVAFEGATLQSLSAKQGIIKQGKHLEQQYNLDISGPILPGMFSKLCKVFESTQDNQFSAATKLLQATTPFNVVLPGTDTEQPATTTEQNYFEQHSSLCTTGLTHAKCKSGFYTWETS